MPTRLAARVFLPVATASLLLAGLAVPVGAAEAEPVPSGASEAEAVPSDPSETKAKAEAVPSGGAKAKKGWKPAYGAKFNVPRSKPATQFRLERQVLESIKKSKEGSTIRLSMFSFDRFPIANALIKARKRGVTVQVLVNDHEGSGAQNKLRRTLGKNPKKNNFIYQCYKSCRGTGNTLHSKFYLFTKAGSAEHVVMIGSINMKLNGHKNQYNDLTTFSSEKVHDRLVALFNQMREDRDFKGAYFNEKVSGAVRLQATPYRGPWSTDPINYHLKKVKCKTGKGRTVIRANMHAWDGERGVRVAQKVRSLYAAGCDVKVQYGYGGALVREVFGNPTKRGYVPVRSSGMDTNGDGEIDLYSHLKYMTIKGNYDGKNRRVVITGSSNYQRDGITGDEVIIRLYKGKLYNQYVKHYNWMWSKRTRPVPYQRIAVTTGQRLGRVVGTEMLTREQAEALPGELPKLRLVEEFGTNSPEWNDE